MKKIKNFDYFRKTEHAKATRMGGFVSILCFCVRQILGIILVYNVLAVHTVLDVSITSC